MPIHIILYNTYNNITILGNVITVSIHGCRYLCKDLYCSVIKSIRWMLRISTSK